MSARYHLFWKADNRAWEKVDDAGTENRAYDLLSEYRLAFGSGRWRIVRRGKVIYED